MKNRMVILCSVQNLHKLLYREKQHPICKSQEVDEVKSCILFYIRLKFCKVFSIFYLNGNIYLKKKTFSE